jgi:hypothetical protein
VKTPRFFSRARELLALALFAAFALSVARPQSAATGSVEGRVLNTTSGAYLENARVSVEGTTLTTFTNNAGEYPARRRARGTGDAAGVLHRTRAADRRGRCRDRVGR